MKNYYLLGEHLGHSFSAIIHNRPFQEQGLNARYSLCELPPNMLESKLMQLKTESGANVTIPYKHIAALHMDELLGDARATGAINTIIPQGNRLVGENTDGEGFMRAIGGWAENIRGEKALVIGAGGAAHVIAYKLALAGAKVHISARRNASDLAQKINLLVPGAAQASSPEGEWYLAVNATPVGMGTLKGQSPLPAQADFKCFYAFDCIYNPKKTPFLAQAEEKGAQCLNGLTMLWHQAIKSQELWGNHFDSQVLNKVWKEVSQL